MTSASRTCLLTLSPSPRLMSPPSTLYPLLMALGGYKVSRRAARWAEGSTQLCMASTMLRMWSPRRRLPAESGGRRRKLSEWSPGKVLQGLQSLLNWLVQTPALPVTPCMNLDNQLSPFCLSFPVCTVHGPAQLLANHVEDGNRIRPPPHLCISGKRNAGVSLMW